MTPDSSLRVEGAPSFEDVHEFLRRLGQRMSATALETALPQQPHTALREVSRADDLVGRFAAAAEAAGCHVHRASEHNWLRVLQEILRIQGARKVVVEPRPGTALTDRRAAALWDALATGDVAVATERDDETLFAVDAAITGVTGGIAETGTLVCTSDESSARGVSLIPPVHIALVDDRQLAADLFDTFEQFSGWPRLPANVNLITGPSKTADIEGVLVTGVHGPGMVHVVLITGQAV